MELSKIFFNRWRFAAEIEKDHNHDICLNGLMRGFESHHIIIYPFKLMGSLHRYRFFVGLHKINTYENENYHYKNFFGGRLGIEWDWEAPNVYLDGVKYGGPKFDGNYWRHLQLGKFGITVGPRKEIHEKN